MSGEQKDELTTFFLAFMGQFVTVTTDTKVRPNPDIEVPLYYEGILLDQDDEHLFLGETPDEITQAVRKEHYIHICVTERKDPLTAMLDDLPGPTSREDVN